MITNIKIKQPFLPHNKQAPRITIQPFKCPFHFLIPPRSNNQILIKLLNFCLLNKTNVKVFLPNQFTKIVPLNRTTTTSYIKRKNIHKEPVFFTSFWLLETLSFLSELLMASNGNLRLFLIELPTLIPYPITSKKHQSMTFSKSSYYPTPHPHSTTLHNTWWNPLKILGPMILKWKNTAQPLLFLLFYQP